MKTTQSKHLIQITDQANPARHPAPELSLNAQTWYGYFQAMASDCLILLEGCDADSAEQLLRLAAIETWRIEFKYSRYQQNNLMASINQAFDTPLQLDDETSALLNYANFCYQASDGLFDISAGVLRKIWRFDGSDNVPSAESIAAVLPYIGWHKVKWKPPFIQLQAGMELDLGGLGKEYAVDKVLQLLTTESTQRASTPVAILVNFGGDLACSGPRLHGQPWKVAVESHLLEKKSVLDVKLSSGAIATSGDARRFLLKDGIRYSHILNPLSGQAITDAPHSVSVAAATCMQAGMLSTLAMLHGAQAEAFLEAQEADFWVQR
jgi:thiamine biosynthesis lipoprotein